MAERDKTRITQYETNEGIALAHTLYGGPTSQLSAVSDSIGSNVGLATWSTAPYIPPKPPKRRERDAPDKALCAEDGCKAWPVKDLLYCAGHARTNGILPTCQREGCNGAPMAPMGTPGFCHHHQPKIGSVDLDDIPE